jgi:copper(I)-binding protein
VIRRSLLAGAVALLVVPALAGCEAGLNAPTLEFHPASSGAHTVVDGITITNVFVLAAPSGSSVPAGSKAGLFMGLFNSGASDDTLLAVETPAATTTTITGGSVALPANAGAYLTGPTPKVILNGLTQSLTGGQSVEVILDFQHAGAVPLNVPVEPQSFYYASLSQPPSPTPTPSVTTSATTTAPGTKPAATATPATTATPTPTRTK